MPVDSRIRPADEPCVIVIGGTGWTGRAICRALNRAGIPPLPIGRRDAPFLPLEEFLRRHGGVTGTYKPLAVVNSIRPSTESDAEVYVDISGHLARSCRRLGLKYIHVGSAAEYGSDFDGLIEEDTRKRPDTPYGIRKLRASQSALKLGGVVVRPFNLVGPEQPIHTVVGEWVQQLKDAQAGRPSITIRNGSVKRDFVPLTLLGDAVVWLIRNSPDWNSLNVCTGNATSFGQYCEWLIQVARRQRITSEKMRISDLGQGRSTQMIGDPRRLDSILTSTPVNLESLAVMSLS